MQKLIKSNCFYLAFVAIHHLENQWKEEVIKKHVITSPMLSWNNTVLQYDVILIPQSETNRLKFLWNNDNGTEMQKLQCSNQHCTKVLNFHMFKLMVPLQPKQLTSGRITWK